MFYFLIINEVDKRLEEERRDVKPAWWRGVWKWGSRCCGHRWWRGSGTRARQSSNSSPHPSSCCWRRSVAASARNRPPCTRRSPCRKHAAPPSCSSRIAWRRWRRRGPRWARTWRRGRRRAPCWRGTVTPRFPRRRREPRRCRRLEAAPAGPSGSRSRRGCGCRRRRPRRPRPGARTGCWARRQRCCLCGTC